MGSTRVEVPQKGAIPLLKRLACLLQVPPLRLDVVSDDRLDHRLCATVCVGRADGAVLGDGNHVLEAGRVTVDRGRGREDDVGDIVLAHGAQERDTAAHVDAIVFEGDFARFADGL
jgi:hypothetical protein